MKLKDSGVEWIGMIPEEWEIISSKYLFSERKGKMKPGDVQLTASQKYGMIPQQLFIKLAKQKPVVLDKNFENFKHVDKGDFVISLRSFQGGIEFSEYTGAVSPAYTVIIPKSRKIYRPYYRWLFKNISYIQAIGVTSDSLRDGKSLKWSNFILVDVPVPKVSEQQKIADFLDSKIALIDQIIADTKRSIEELKAYKQSLITETVTKGLDPNVPMKDSDVEWIGEIPEGWEVRKAKYFGNVRNGLTYKPEQLVDEKEGILILRSGNIQDGKLSFEDNQYVAGEIPKNLMVKNDDILITSRNGSAKLIGKSAIINNNIQATFGAFMMLFTPNQTVNAQYFCYLLNSNGFDFYRGLFSSSTINQLTRKTFNNMSFPYPKKEIQKEIVLFLDERIKKLDDIIKDKNLVISENESYKKSLIYEYVTGKKQVN